MGKLYFNYGVMSSSKSANALMTKFNYEQKGFNVILLKPSIDNRNSTNEIVSRIGLKAKCEIFTTTTNLYKYISNMFFLSDSKKDIIIIDEAQFCTESQINQLKKLSLTYDVICYGLLTDFKTHLFVGSKRLIEIADEIKEIVSVCTCGNKANVNARFVNNKLVISGDQILIGGDEKYKVMCYNCWKALQDNMDK